MRLYALLCQEVGVGPEDRRLLEALSRSCSPSRRFRSGSPVPSVLLQAASLALLGFSALVFAARFLG